MNFPLPFSSDAAITPFMPDSTPSSIEEVASLSSATYDKVAPVYDHLFSGRLRGPHARLTEQLRLRPGERLADIACGTGLDTLEMARHLGHGEVVAVDHSRQMLERARERLQGAVSRFALMHARAEEFIGSAPPHSFDVVSMRFVLAYIDWRAELPRLGRLVKEGGRVGVMTSLSCSLTQLQHLIESFDGSLSSLWKLMRGFDTRQIWELFQLKLKLGAEGRPAVPMNAQEVADRLRMGGLTDAEHWTETVRFWFSTGEEAVTWAIDSGYATHPALATASASTVQAVTHLLARGMEEFREPAGVPLDLVVSGVVARKN